jgi:hypothetical protein
MLGKPRKSAYIPVKDCPALRPVEDGRALGAN